MPETRRAKAFPSGRVLAAPPAMLRQALVVTLLALTAGCASEREETPVTSSAALEGAYHAEIGPFVWTSFLGEEYIAIRGGAGCDAVNPADACVERGRFTLDSASGMLRLRTDAGVEKTLPIVVHEVEARSSLTIASTQLVQGGGQQLLSPNVVTSFSLVDKNKELVQEAELRKVMIICRVVGLILNPPAQPVIVPPNPPPIVQTQQCAGASAKG